MSVRALSYPLPQVQSESAKDALLDKIAINAFWTAAHLTDPICKTHETYRRIHLVDALAPPVELVPQPPYQNRPRSQNLWLWRTCLNYNPSRDPPQNLGRHPPKIPLYPSADRICGEIPAR